MSTKSRTVRVFLSSTFRDFAEERDLLVRKVFHDLRRRCRQRQVELVDVDLRWGITEDDAQQGKVLPICLAEIDRSRPYFMGFLGERYGWVPDRDQYDLSLLLEQPWLDEHRGGKRALAQEVPPRGDAICFRKAGPSDTDIADGSFAVYKHSLL